MRISSGVTWFAILTAQGVYGQTLIGRVQDLSTRQPVAAVDVSVLTENEKLLGRAQTDSLGRFTVQWTAAERVRVRTERIGFVPSTSEVFTVRSGEAVTVRMWMSTSAIQVDPLTISARERANDVSGNLAEIERRKQLGGGKFIMREEIRQSGASQISHVLMNVPGIYLQPEANNQHAVHAYSLHNAGVSRSAASRRRNSADCPMTIFLDGRIHRHPISGVNVVPADDIEAIEVYRGLAEVPVEFAGEHARCGIIALWTTRGV